MTILVGINCTDGIVIGSDSATTFSAHQHSTIEQSSRKIEIIENAIIVAGTGQVGLGQRFSRILQEAYNQKIFSTAKNEIDLTTSLASNTIKQFSSTNIILPNIDYGALVAFPNNKSIHLCEFSFGTFQPELKDDRIWYVSMGSGQIIVDPFLALMRKVFWGNSKPTINDGTFAVTWALRHAIDCNSGGINDPIQIAQLKIQDGKHTAKLLTTEELQEHEQNIECVEKYLSKYPNVLKEGSSEKLPKPPAK